MNYYQINDMFDTTHGTKFVINKTWYAYNDRNYECTVYELNDFGHIDESLPTEIVTFSHTRLLEYMEKYEWYHIKKDHFNEDLFML